MPLLGLFIVIALSYFIGFLGRNRKLGFWGYFFASMVLTPLIGLLLVVATDPAQDTKDKPKIFKKAGKDNTIEETGTE
jgi:uncharacterized membrane protein YiaA